MSESFSVGNIVNTRGRDFIVVSKSKDTLTLSPLSGEDDSLSYVSVALEDVKLSYFSDPDPKKSGAYNSGVLFKTAVSLLLRYGAGPFRCFGHIAIEPRLYQMVPLLMALRMDTVRLLIADDVGIGKTIEAGLIAMELWDRKEINNIVILTPPHLVEQWVDEMYKHFNLTAVALTGSSVTRLEKNLPKGMNFLEKYPVVVVSLDYIKSSIHAESFDRMNPDFIIVDEAHTAVEKKGQEQQRFNLLKKLASKKDRHLVMLTATPHSGDDEAFSNLLSLLDEKFSEMGSLNDENKELRKELAKHLVQRRRQDISDKEGRTFPERLTSDVVYKLTPEWEKFLFDVRDACRETAEKKNSPVIWYALLSLFRCISSSPLSAISALKSNSDLTDDIGTVDAFDSDSTPNENVDSVTIFNKNKLLKEAEELLKKTDPKFEKLLFVIKDLKKEGYNPVIFCKYIATAEYVGDKLRATLSKAVTVDVVTGKLTPAEREERINRLGLATSPILVATDCLSEGINLQAYFNAVVHYDLAWNPTRHEQREGRVDRFGQSSEKVKTVLLYGSDNPVDGFILKVIIEKARNIQKELGVTVPVPENNAAVNKALIKSTFLKKKESNQLYFDFEDEKDVEETFSIPWKKCEEKTRKVRTIFRQDSIHPDELVSSLKSSEDSLLGSPSTVMSFVLMSMQNIGVNTNTTKEGVLEVDFDTIPSRHNRIKERLNELGYKGKTRLSFTLPSLPKTTYIHRTSPLVEALANYEKNQTLSNTGSLARSGVTESELVDYPTYIYLIRTRTELKTYIKNKENSLMAEEVILIRATKEDGEYKFFDDEKESDRLLDTKAQTNFSESFIEKSINTSLDIYKNNKAKIETILLNHAEKIKEEHDSVRSSLKRDNSNRTKVMLSPEWDLLGVYVLQPKDF